MQLFAEGGLNDEGGMIDEVSGNEVPIGGTKEGVRDDIPANVSEGEFIMPADVVRYHGLDKMMEIRQEAKMGLKKMEAMGQMGNSDEATMDDDMPFDMADLIVVGGSGEPMSFADGGFVPSYFPGGMVELETAYVPTTDNTETTEVNYSAYMDSVTTVVKEYRNAAGETMAITFINGEPTTPVPEGYSLYTPVAGEAGVAPSAAGSVAAVYNSTNNNNDNEPDINGTGQFAGYRDPNAAPVAEVVDYAGMSDSEFAARMELENGKGYQFGKVLGYAIASMIPGGVTLMYGANRQHTRRSEERLNRMIEGSSGAVRARYIAILNETLDNAKLKPTDKTNSVVQAVDSLLVDKGYTTDIASSASKNGASIGETPFVDPRKPEDRTASGSYFPPTQSPPVEVTEVSADNPLGGPQYTAREIEQAAELGMELSNDGSGVRTVDGLVNASSTRANIDESNAARATAYRNSEADSLVADMADLNARIATQKRKYANEAANRQMTEAFSYTPPTAKVVEEVDTRFDGVPAPRGVADSPRLSDSGGPFTTDIQLEAYTPPVEAVPAAETQNSPILSGGPFDNVPRYNPDSLQAAAERAQGNYDPQPVRKATGSYFPPQPDFTSLEAQNSTSPIIRQSTPVDRYTAPEGSASSGIAPATITDTELKLAPTKSTATVRPTARPTPNTRYQDFANRLTPGDGKEYVNNVLVDKDGNRVNNLYQNAANFLTPFDGEEYKKGVIGTTDRSTTSSRSSSSRASIQKNINAKIKAATNSSGEVTWTPEINALVKKRDGSRTERKIGTVNGVPDRIIGADYSREDANRAKGGNSTNPLTKSANYPQTKTNPGGYENNQSDENGPKDKAIVCTEMYRQTELADWQQAMKIWHIYQERYLTIHHQVGYHWLFKPYVKGMKNSSILTKLGSALAKHRTQHLRYVLTKGKAKDDLLGNIWCKFIHPIVYVAGIIKKKVGK